MTWLSVWLVNNKSYYPSIKPLCILRSGIKNER
jgi:hypothetical protein